jgi:hypothetical protein
LTRSDSTTVLAVDDLDGTVLWYFWPLGNADDGGAYVGKIRGHPRESRMGREFITGVSAVNQKFEGELPRAVFESPYLPSSVDGVENEHL